MKAIVVYESLTGTTKQAGETIAELLTINGVQASASPITLVDHQALSEADLVIVGSWTDGVFLFGQKPGRAGRLLALPVIDGKQAAVYCTYAIDPGKTLSKLASIVTRRGGDVVGGYAIKRNEVTEGAEQFVARLLSQLPVSQLPEKLDAKSGLVTT